MTMISGKERMLLRFMRMTIERVNDSLMRNYATAKLLLEKGIITPQDFSDTLAEARRLPELNLGKKVLEEMLATSEGSELILGKGVLAEMLKELGTSTKPLSAEKNQ